MGHPAVIAITLALVAGFFLGRGYEQAKVRYALWKISPGTQRFGRSVRGLAILAAAAAVIVLAVQARGR